MMSYGDSYDFRRSQQTGSLHTEIRTLGTSTRERDCRVCGAPMAGCTSGRRREYGLEVAHAGCGWFKDDRVVLSGEVSEVRRPGTDFSFFEWACPTCHLDACSTRHPIGGEDRRCKRCRSGIQVGSIVRPLMSAVGWSSTMARTTRFARHRIAHHRTPAYWLESFAFDRARVTAIVQAGMVIPEELHRIPFMVYAQALFLEGSAVRHTFLVDVADLVLG